MATTLIPHLAHEPRKGTWWRNNDRNFWGCPKCGQAHEFHHRVYEDGEVTPSMICGKCDFHDYVVLDEVAPECVTR